MTSRRWLALAAAVVALAATFALGAAVSSRSPSRFEVALLAALAGHGVAAATVFTYSGTWRVLVTLGALAVALAFLAPPWRTRALCSIVLTIVAWQTSDAIKLLFARARPPRWFGLHETSYGYPSGHAMMAIVVYGLWAFFAARSALPAPARRSLAIVLSLWAAAVVWSRLALSAHYPSDLAGGALLGTAFVAFAIAIVPSIVDPPSVQHTILGR